MIRRDFLRKAMAVPAVMAVGGKIGSNLVDGSGGIVADSDTLNAGKSISPHIHDLESTEGSKPDSYKTKPKSLSDGSVVAFTAPASAANTAMIRRGVATFETFGCKVILGDTIKYQDRSYKYLSASDEKRAEEFMSFINDESVDAIICGRGGYGVMRMLHLLDWEAIKNNPKIIMGFSDITALVNPVYSIANIISFHGPVGYSSFNRFTTDYVKKLLFSSDWAGLEVSFSGGENFAAVMTAQGELIGGNLKLVASLMGTPYQPDFKDKILFIEDVSEQPYKIDRMLSQLMLAGVFQQVKGILIGNIGSLDAKYSFKPYGSFTIRQVFEQLLGPLDIPVMAKLPFGHTKNNLTMPIGTKVEIDSVNMKMRFLESPVS